MIDLSFRTFVERYNNATIWQDATWRAYDFDRHEIKPTHIKKALNQLNRRITRELVLCIDRIRVDYGITTAERTRMLLGLWYLWKSVSDGGHPKGLQQRSANDE